MKKVLSFLLSLFVMFSAIAFPHIEAVAEDMHIEIDETFSDDDILSADSTITPEEPGDGGGSLTLENASKNVYIKSTSNIYLGKDVNGVPIGSTTAGFNRFKWQLIENADGTYHIVSADSTVENEVPYKFALSCSASGVISLEAYAISDEKQKWEINTVTVSNSVYNTIESYNGYFLNILSSGGVSAATVVCLNNVIQCSNTAQMTLDTMEYIDKINNSGLITQMNCYAYALGVYHKYEPTLEPSYEYEDRYLYYWNIDRLQMGEIAGVECNPISVFGNSAYYTVSSNGARSLNADGKTAVKNMIVDAVEDDLHEMYSYSGGIMSTTNDAVCFSDWRKVALVIDTQDIYVVNGYYMGGFDYHWYVQHDDGTWTHKPGLTAVTAYDEANDIITDPATAASGRYNYFAGYYMIRCDYILNDALNGIHSTTFQNDGAGDIVAHAYSSTVEIPTTYDKLFYGEIEYGRCDLWNPDFINTEGDACRYVYDMYDTYSFKMIYNLHTETPSSYGVVYGTPEEVEAIERSDIYASISVTNSHTDSPDLPCDVDFYEFTVVQTGSYKIYTDYRSSTEQLDTYGILYHNNTVLYTNDDGNNRNFSITAYLTAGETYRISVKANDQKDIGEYKLYISYQG